MNFFRNRAVLVTGGASFIGSHLVERLVELGAKIRVADDLSSGKLQNLQGVMSSIEFMQGDLRDRNFANSATKNQHIVFHLAASHGGRGYIDSHPVECCTNMILDGQVFASAQNAGVERVCFTSSACVYPISLQEKPQGNNEYVYLKEEDASPFHQGKAFADGEYGWAKLMGEMALAAYVKQYGMKGVSCRLFTAYGERENESHAVIALIAKAFIKMDPYEIWGDGNQDRNFTYVGDIVEGLVRSCEHITDGTAVNIGTSEHIKIIDVANLIFNHAQWKPKTLFFDIAKPVGVYSRAADLAHCFSKLNWIPITSFEAGLAQTMDWYFSAHNDFEIRSDFGRKLMER